MTAPANPSQCRAQRRAYKKKVLDALAAAGFELAGEPFAGKESGFFSADFAYPSEFAPAPGLRPHLRIEMTFEAPALPPIERPIRSLVAQALGHAPEVPSPSGGQGRNRTTDTRIFRRIRAGIGVYKSTTCSACHPPNQPIHGTFLAHPI